MHAHVDVVVPAKLEPKDAELLREIRPTSTAISRPCSPPTPTCAREQRGLFSRLRGRSPVAGFQRHGYRAARSVCCCGHSSSNYAVLIVWFVAFAVGRDRIQRLHDRWFRLSDNTFDAIPTAGWPS